MSQNTMQPIRALTGWLEIKGVLIGCLPCP